MFAGMLLLVQALHATPPVIAPDTGARVREVRDTAAIMPTPTSLAPADTNRRRPVAIDYSDAYYERLTIHRWFSYAELPIFGAEYYLGQRLMSTNIQPSWVRPAHAGVAVALGGLFAVNTVTGLWNLWDSRRDPDQKPLIIAHSLLMLSADAGFFIAAQKASDARLSTQNANIHRNWAIGSFGVATVGTVMMWLLRK